MPLDYAHTKGTKISLAAIRHPATDPSHRLGSLFYNPGGPGASGVKYLPDNYKLFPATVRERFDIVSWDPRGIGSSSPVRCLADSQKAKAFLGGLPPGFPVTDSQRSQWVDSFTQLADQCKDRQKDLLRHVSTWETAHDLDLLRQAVGDKSLTYLGVSYGTFLGAVYANLHPGNVRAMVLDGNVDPRAYTTLAEGGQEPLPTSMRLKTDLGSAKTIDAFLDLCAKVPVSKCAFSTGAQTRSKYATLMERLKAGKVSGVTYPQAVSDTVQGLYTVLPEGAFPGWQGVATRLQDMWQGHAPKPAGSPPAPEPQQGPDEYPGIEPAYAVLCGDSPNPQAKNGQKQAADLYQRFADQSAARAGDSGRYWVWTNEPCSTWPAQAAHPYRGPWDKPSREASKKILVTSTSHDPATPYEGSEAMTRALGDNSYLLPVSPGYGHTVLFNPSRCAQDIESTYLITGGTLPSKPVRCTQDAKPFA
ncbi:alpha/beta hydrolase [Streptomyces klenkii]|uniref:alpha/beta hydrolase n=1 Tax=Streptomyces klenkii TaxID=1420899 RepID=UPI00343B0FAC